jgi:hypothetical protein
MNNKKLATLLAILLAGLPWQNANAQGTNTMNYRLYADLTVFLPTSANSNNQNGRIWVGNFGSDSSGTLLSPSGISSTFVGTRSSAESLLQQFRPAFSWEVGSGKLSGDTGNGLSGLLGVGNAVANTDAYTVAANQYAAQPAYLLALSETSTSWSSALTNWRGDAGSTFILLHQIDYFGAGNPGDPTSDFGLDPGSGSLIAGNATDSTITGVVPEPSTAGLLVLGLAGLGALRAARRKD